MGRLSEPPTEAGVQLKFEEKSSVMSKDTRKVGHFKQNHSRGIGKVTLIAFQMDVRCCMGLLKVYT